MFLFRYLNDWRKNPHWSFSCCLALLLPLNDLQGEIRGLAGGNVFKDQLQTGQSDKPSFYSSMKNSGAIDVTLEDDKQRDANIAEIQDENCQDAVHSDTRRHQGTQTELCCTTVADFAAHGPVTHSHEEPL